MATHTRDQLELANACHPSMPDAARRAGFFFKESRGRGTQSAILGTIFLCLR